MKEKRNIGAIILAAGKGKRMNEKEINKVALRLCGKPLIAYSVELLSQMKIKPVLVVVGHARESVINALKDADVLFIRQNKQLGTGHAVKTAIKNKILLTARDIIILYGDDSYLYNKKVLNKIINKHNIEQAMLTFLTIKVPSARGLGRIIRDNNGEVIDIIEEKDATAQQRKINEINPNCYIFKKEFLLKYVTKISKSPVTGEYYLTSLIKIGRENNEKILTVDGGTLPWKGINTKEDLEQAKNMI